MEPNTLIIITPNPGVYEYYYLDEYVSGLYTPPRYYLDGTRNGHQIYPCNMKHYFEDAANRTMLQGYHHWNSIYRTTENSSGLFAIGIGELQLWIQHISRWPEICRWTPRHSWNWVCTPIFFHSFVQSFCVFAELTRLKGIEFSVGTTSARPCVFRRYDLTILSKAGSKRIDYLIHANGRSLTPMPHLKELYFDDCGFRCNYYSDNSVWVAEYGAMSTLHDQP